MIRIRSAD